MTPAERRAAIWRVGAVFLVGLLAWLALSSLVHRDSGLVRLGRVWEIEFAWVRAEQADRVAACGARPAVLLVGSSITRDAFDAEVFETGLRQRGIDACVRKYAFGRGAPLFTRAMTAKLDVRPGDLVITSVSVDNFRTRWLEHFKSADRYVQFALTPGQIFEIDELSPADKVEYSLSWLPPRQFFQYQSSFQNGVHRWVVARLFRFEAPVVPERFDDDPYDRRHRDPKFRETPRTFRLTEPLFDLSPTQTNIEALTTWSREVQERGASPWVVFVPPHPEHDPKFLAPTLTDTMHAWMASNLPYYAKLPALPDESYIDYKHPNDVGRPVLTAALADLLARDWRSGPRR